MAGQADGDPMTEIQWPPTAGASESKNAFLAVHCSASFIGSIKLKGFYGYVHNSRESEGNKSGRVGENFWHANLVAKPFEL